MHPSNYNKFKWTSEYRRDIDGLRAIAVLSVILNHMNPRYAPSGYLGVDVFFVISGFVITHSLSRYSSTTLTEYLKIFFARRLRRIFPALVVCVAITSLAAWAIDPLPEVSLKTGISALLGASNIFLLHISADYFAQTAAQNFFTHTWSLGVEEQFYFLFPILIWLIGPFTGPNREKLFVAILSLIGALSFMALFILPGAKGGIAFYLPVGRLWEFFLGAAMVFFPTVLPKTSTVLKKRSTQLACLIALISIFFLPISPSATWSFLAVLPAAVLMLGPNGPHYNQLLSFTGMVSIGRISYSLYLWHWPVISLTSMLFKPTLRLLVIQLILTFMFAILSFYFVERPLRESPILRHSRKLFAGAAGALFSCMILIYGLLVLTNPKPLSTAVFNKLPEAFPAWPGSPYPHAPHCVIDHTRQWYLKPDTLAKCTLKPTNSGQPTIWVIGDSHAGHLRGLLRELHSRAGYGIHLVEIPGLAFPIQRGLSFPSQEELFERIKANLKRGDVIVLSRLLLTRDGLIRPVSDLDTWLSDVESFSDAMQPLGVSITVVAPLPIFRFTSISVCRPVSNSDSTPCDENRSEMIEARSEVTRKLQSIEARTFNMRVFDPFPALCPEFQSNCGPLKQRTPLYRDRDHLNGLGAAQLFDSFLRHLNPL